MNNHDQIVELALELEDSEQEGQSLSPKQVCEKNGCLHLLEDLERAVEYAVTAASCISELNESENRDPIGLVNGELDHSVRYRVIQLANDSGGMGLIYSAEEGDLRRRVAVKVLRHSGDAEDFRRELQIASGLDHPGVPPIYSAGVCGDEHFYTMRFIDGRTLEEELSAFHADPQNEPTADNVAFRRLLTAFISVCKTLAYAHSHGVIHRDIKPANIMLGSFGETIVLDWGLAARIFEPSEVPPEDLNCSGMTVQFAEELKPGVTPAYMSPEQALHHDIGLLSDVYNLGATLFKVVTNRPPVESGNISVLRERVIQGEIPAPSTHKPTLAPALEAICLKAMQRKPRDRYQSAMELAEDVEIFLSGGRVRAYKETFTETVSRWTAHHAGAVKMGFLGVFIILFLLVGLVINQSSNARMISAANKEGLLAQADLCSEELKGTLEFASIALRETVDDPEFIKLVREVNENPELEAKRAELNELLHQKKATWERTNRVDETATGSIWENDKKQLVTAAWVVNVSAGGKGIQAARSPEFVDAAKQTRFSSIGNEYANRQYFNGMLLPPDKPRSPYPPIEQAILTAPFRGSNNNSAVVLSHPIKGAEEEAPLGIAGIVFELNQITQLYHLLPQGNKFGNVILTVVHAGEDRFDKDLGKGLIIQHDYFTMENSDLSKGFRLSEESLQQLVAAADTEERALVTDYQDPIGKVCPDYAGDWNVAASRVQGTDWILLLQSR